MTVKIELYKKGQGVLKTFPDLQSKEKKEEIKAKQEELNSFFKPLITILEKQGLVVDDSNVEPDSSLSAIGILKAMGYKIFKPVQKYEEI